MISHKIMNIISKLAILVMCILPVDMFLGWYLLIYGGSFVIYAMFKIGLLLLGSLVLLFWLGFIVSFVYAVKER